MKLHKIQHSLSTSKVFDGHGILILFFLGPIYEVVPQAATTKTLPLSQGGIISLIILKHIWISYVHHRSLS